MASPTAGDVLVDTLIDWGVDTIFGLPGDGINGIIEALRTRQDRVRFIQVRHEEGGIQHGRLAVTCDGGRVTAARVTDETGSIRLGVSAVDAGRG
jgi:pyruvate dehydrogenase (quinone)